MARYPSIAVTAAAIAALTTMGLPAAFATTADDATGLRSAADTSHVVNLRPRPRPTATPTASPTSPATATPTASPTAPVPACGFTTSSFNGGVYCPATIADVKSTNYGTGARVVLKSVTVTAVNPTASTVTVAAWALPPCTPGNFCGQTLTLQSVTVPWTAASRPAYGDVLDLFGVTITASITPDGYITTGNCPIDYC